MERRELERIFDQMRPTPEQEKAMLDRILEPGRKIRPMKKQIRWRRWTAAVVVAALLLMTCAFAVAAGLDQRLIEYFRGTPEDSELLSSAAVEVAQGHTYENGWTVEVVQVLLDRCSLAAVVEVTAPEGTKLDPAYAWSLEMDPHITSAKGDEILLGGSFLWAKLEDLDPGDNTVPMLWMMDLLMGVEDLRGGSFSLTPTQLFWSGEEGPIQFPEEWSCTGTLPAADPGLLYQMDESLVLDGKKLWLNSIYLSPIRLVFEIAQADPTDESLHENRDTIAVVLRDGSKVKMKERVYASSSDQTGETEAVRVLLQPEKFLNPAEAVSVELYGQIFPLEGRTPGEKAPEDNRLEVGERHTYDSGWTVAVEQVTADRCSLTVLAEVTAPEGTEPDLEYASAISMDLWRVGDDGSRELVTGTQYWTELEDPDPGDGSIPMLWMLNTDSYSQQILGETFSLEPAQFFWDAYQPAADFQGEWACTLTVPDRDVGRRCVLEETVEVSGHPLPLSEIYLSPSHLVVEMKEPTRELAQVIDQIYEDGGTYFSVRLRDGRTVGMLESGSCLTAEEAGEDGAMTGRFLFLTGERLDPAEVVSITLYGQTFPL